MGEITYATFTECGVRKDNEDYCQIATKVDEKRYLFVVCDGMGGHAMGEVASRVVCSSICDSWSDMPSDIDIDIILNNAFTKASLALDDKADVLNHVMMGTTMVLAAIDNDNITIAHCGDSRCYFTRPKLGVVYQTKDHVKHNIWGDFVDRCFFSYNREKAYVEIRHFKLQPGDRIFLCTDGVSQYVAPNILIRRLNDNKKPEEIIDVIQFLCEKFSKDNYSGILVFYE